MSEAMRAGLVVNVPDKPKAACTHSEPFHTVQRLERRTDGFVLHCIKCGADIGRMVWPPRALDTRPEIEIDDDQLRPWDMNGEDEA